MNEKSGKNRPAGIGTGYLSLMMIFVMLCLTMLAALSLSAAESGKKFSERSAEYTKEYYAADLAAKEKLAEIDAAVSGYDDYSDFMLLAELDGMEGVEYIQTPTGLEVSFLTAINERQSISLKVKFSRDGFEVLSLRTVSTSDAEEEPLGVWQGE